MNFLQCESKCQSEESEKSNNVLDWTWAREYCIWGQQQSLNKLHTLYWSPFLFVCLTFCTKGFNSAACLLSCLCFTMFNSKGMRSGTSCPQGVEFSPYSYKAFKSPSSLKSIVIVAQHSLALQWFVCRFSIPIALQSELKCIQTHWPVFIAMVLESLLL